MITQTDQADLRQTHEADRHTVVGLSTGSRLFWAWVGAAALWGVVTVVQLIWHHSVN